ncbi:MAG: NERD domain-containing protein [Candidatus Omnitrophica bacterium]|nr:NERD domain-containing protein [Candidatus Omnitrophota bacterium]
MWGCPNPQGKEKGKELCDFLVVCDPYIIIFSVKEIQFLDKGDTILAVDRWRRKAIEESTKQIYGAEHLINTLDQVVKNNRENWLQLPGQSMRRVFRIAVALGSKGQAPILSKDFGRGFVHVFDEVSFGEIICELDTIIDIVNYLKAKEELFSRETSFIITGGEEDLMAFYLCNNSAFPKRHDVVVVDEGVWSDFSKSLASLQKKRDDKISYAWDRLIEIFCEDFYNGDLEIGDSLEQIEFTMREMARESRFNRRILAKHFTDFLNNAKKKKIRSRKVQSPSGTVYVFLVHPRGEDRQFRIADLGNRCFVARGTTRGCRTVVGIATETYEGKAGFSLDVVYLHMPTWTEEDQAHCDSMQNELNYFLNPMITLTREQEYPDGHL